MRTLNVTELKQHLEKNTVLLIDVREPGEHQTACIEEARLIPLSTISLKTIGKTDKPLVIHCHSGKRSLSACQRLLAENPDLEVYSLEGGLAAWEQAGFPIKRSGRHILPLDRQIQIVAGSLILIGMLLGTWLASEFYFIPGFVGAGLLFAGITGWCGMAKLLAIMPWNKS